MLNESDGTFKYQSLKLLQLLYRCCPHNCLALLEKFKYEVQEMFDRFSTLNSEEILIKYNES